MAIIIKCRQCKARRKTDQGLCQACGGTEVGYIIDYWPNGRHGKRCQRYLDESIKSLAIAREIDRSTKLAIRERRNPEVAQDLPEYTQTFEELIDGYMSDYRLNRLQQQSVNKVRAEKSFNEREGALRIISKIIGPTPVILFDEHVAKKFQLTRSQHITNRRKPVSSCTINKELIYVQSFLNWCRKEKKIPVQRFEWTKLDYRRPKPTILSPQETVRFMAAADDEPLYKAFFLCLYTLGFRFSEAAYLRRRDVDRSTMTVRAIQKGGSEKIEPLNIYLDQALKRLEKWKPKEPKRGKPLVHYPNKEGYYFVSLRTGRPISNVKKAIVRVATKAGITKHITPHTLRHSIATHMLASGKNIRTIQDMLGHADIESTTWYTHVVTGNIKDATEGMFDEMFDPVLPTSTVK